MIIVGPACYDETASIKDCWVTITITINSFHEISPPGTTRQQDVKDLWFITNSFRVTMNLLSWSRWYWSLPISLSLYRLPFSLHNRRSPPTRCTEWPENTQTRLGTLPLASAPLRWDWCQVFEFVSLSIIVVTLSDKKLSSSDHGLFYFSCTKLSHQVPTTPPPTPPDFERCHAGVSFVFYYLYCSDYWLLFKCLIDLIYLYCSDYPLNLSLTYSMLSFLQRESDILFGTNIVVYFVIFWHP